MTDPAEGLRKVLSLERSRKFADTAVLGGLDRYLLRFAHENLLSPSHRFSQVLQSLPSGGYRALHPVQRERVVEELLAAVEAEPPAPRPEETRESGRVLEFRRAQSAVGSRKSEIGEPESGVEGGRAEDEAAEPPFEGDGDAPQGAGLRSGKPGSSAPARVPEVIGRLDSPVTVFKGVNKVTAGRLKRLGIETVEDLLFHFPVRYEDYAPAVPINRLRPGQHQTIIG